MEETFEQIVCFFSGNYYFLWRAVYLEKDFPFSHTGDECLGRGKINKNVSVCPMITRKSKAKSEV